MNRTLVRRKRLQAAVIAVAGVILLATVPTRARNGEVELVHIDFDSDTPGQPPSTGGTGQPSYVESWTGTSVLVESSANGISTQPVVLTAQAASQYASVNKWFSPVSDSIVRIEATVALDRLADGYFLQTVTGSAPYWSVVVTRLITTSSGQIQDDVTRTTVGSYASNQPFRIAIQIDMSVRTWSVAVDNELNGFDDDATVSNLPFENPDWATPTVGGVSASINLFPTGSVAPTSVAYDDIQVTVLPAAINVDLDIKPGTLSNDINVVSRGVIPVAILTSDVFDATTVDPQTIRFGETGTEAVPKHYAQEDVDGDGDLDLVLGFETQLTGIQCGAVSARLSGETIGGGKIQGVDSVRTVGCKQGPR